MDDNDMQYDFKNFPKRGLVYIIVNERFTSEGYSDRPGAYTDYKNMKKLFKPLNLKLMTFYDKTAKQIKDILNYASNRQDLAERPCFICIISSHGEQRSEDPTGHMSSKDPLEHAIVGVDGIGVLTKDLVDLFSEESCPHMREKPKLFFIQACRETIYSADGIKFKGDCSKALDPGVNVQYVVSAKVSKHRRMTPKLSTSTNYDSSDNKPEQSALDEIIESDPGGKDTEEEEEEEEDQFSDGYDTATTDNDSDGEEEDRETGHDEVRNRDRSSYTSQYKDVVPEGDSLPGIKQNEAIMPENKPTDQADIVGTNPSNRRVITDIQEIESVEVIAIPCHDDMLVMFASPPGKLAWRKDTEGGWLLASLYNVFKHYIRNNKILDRDFLTLLTEVSQDVSLKETNTKILKYKAMKMIPTIYHQLTKDIVICSIKKNRTFAKGGRESQKLIPK